MTYSSIALVADDSAMAQKAFKALQKHYTFVERIEDADVLVVLGGDGFMLHHLHEALHTSVPIYGMNCGTVGFLMNSYKELLLEERLNSAKVECIYPLKMEVLTVDGKRHQALAVNEVSLLRETKQAAHICIRVDGKVRIDSLVCDGVLVATPAGSTAYNQSVHGPILPMGSQVLALTPISPFRPRRWQGALLTHKVEVEFEVLDPDKRPVSAVADYTEVRDVVKVLVKEDRSQALELLFDPGHSLEERIISEQFLL